MCKVVRAVSYKNIPTGKNPPAEINAIIESPAGGPPVKYELDKKSGKMFVDRFLQTAMRYPGNYGFIPGTLSGDGDPMDVIVVGATPVVPGAVLPCVPVGVLIMEDEAGLDEKIVAVPAGRIDPNYRKIKNYKDLPENMWKQIEHFFSHYKDLEKGKWSKLKRWGDAAEARKLINEAVAREASVQATPGAVPPSSPASPDKKGPKGPS